jgi:hypothetical protein
MTLEDYCSGPSAGRAVDSTGRVWIHSVQRVSSPRKAARGMYTMPPEAPKCSATGVQRLPQNLSSGQAWVVQTDMGASDTSILTPSETGWQKDLGAI